VVNEKGGDNQNLKDRKMSSSSEGLEESERKLKKKKPKMLMLGDNQDLLRIRKIEGTPTAKNSSRLDYSSSAKEAESSRIVESSDVSMI
jgi:hypothetical protein